MSNELNEKTQVTWNKKDSMYDGHYDIKTGKTHHRFTPGVGSKHFVMSAAVPKVGDNKSPLKKFDGIHDVVKHLQKAGHDVIVKDFAPRHHEIKEETKMSDLINAIQEKDFVGAQAEFNREMAERLADTIETKTVELASTLFMDRSEAA